MLEQIQPLVGQYQKGIKKKYRKTGDVEVCVSNKFWIVAGTFAFNTLIATLVIDDHLELLTIVKMEWKLAFRAFWI